MRLLLVLLLPAAIVLLPFLLVGDRLDAALGGPRLVELLAAAGGWAWAVGIALLVADLLLPIPASGVMAALGIVYGPWLGGLIAAAGSFLAGGLGYLVCRRLGRRAALWLLGERDLRRGTELADRHGGWLVTASRALPLLPETVACAAGLVRMRPAVFFAALACGALPMGLAFATLGSLGADRPLASLALATLAPLLLWPVARRALRCSGPPHPALQDERQGEQQRGEDGKIGAAGGGEEQAVEQGDGGDHRHDGARHVAGAAPAQP
jgi:uncharacterized membrane protein YdjX (TVP38/TMEM64 family)